MRPDGSTPTGEQEILGWLDAHDSGDRDQEEQHRTKAVDKADLPG